MGKTKETGRLTKQNAASFKREVNSTLSAMQAQIDQLKQQKSDDAKTISDLRKEIDVLRVEVKQLRDAEFEPAPEVKPDGNQAPTDVDLPVSASTEK